MTDEKQLYDDFRKFNQRLKRHCKRNGLPCYEYIAVAEPQGRGAWHLHLILIFEDKAPYIANDTLAQIWGHGFTKTKSLKGVDNIGVYLTAYLCDMDFCKAFGTVDLKGAKIKSVSIDDDDSDDTDIRGDGDRKPAKAIVKGARLKLYPPHFRLFRCSRGIKKPVVTDCTEKEAMRKVGGAALTFEKTIRLTGVDGKAVNTINYRHYNKRRPHKRGL